MLAAMLAMSPGIGIAAADVLHYGHVFTSSQNRPFPIDPKGRGSIAVTRLLQDLFEPLVISREDGVIVGGVAESWELSEDKTAITFHLRPEAKWSDGAPVRAQDFVFAYNHWPDEKERRKATSIGIEGFGDDAASGVEALDDRTLRVTGTSPYAIDLSMFSRIGFAPLPSHAAPATAKYWSNWEDHPSNGSYTLEQARDDGTYVLRANSLARDALHPTFEVVHHSFAPFLIQRARFEEGQIDLLIAVPSRAVLDMLEQGHLLELSHRSLVFLALNRNKPELKDPRVREALKLALDQDQIADLIYQSRKIISPAFGVAPRLPGVWENEPWSEDRFERARSLMIEAGYSAQNPLRIKLLTPYNTLYESIYVLYRGMLSRIHVDATLDVIQSTVREYRTRLERGDFHVSRRTVSANPQTLKGFLAICTTPGRSRCGYPEIDVLRELLVRADFAPDEAAAIRLLRTAQDVLMDQHTVAPIGHTNRYYALGERIERDRSKTLYLYPQSYKLVPRAR